MVKYIEVIDTLFLPDFEKYIPDGAGFSIPIMSLIGADIIDNFFIYSKSPDGSTCSIPLARLGINVQTQELCYYESSSDNPFKSVKANSEGMICLTPLGNNPNIGNKIKKMQHYYSEVRDFIFETSLEENQKEILIKYMKSLFSCIEPEIKPLYIELVPSFFQWVNETIS